MRALRLFGAVVNLGGLAFWLTYYGATASAWLFFFGLCCTVLALLGVDWSRS